MELRSELDPFMKLSRHGRRTVIAVLLLTTLSFGCGSSRWAYVTSRWTAKPTVDVCEKEADDANVGATITRKEAETSKKTSKKAPSKIRLAVAEDDLPQDDLAQNESAQGGSDEIDSIGPELIDGPTETNPLGNDPTSTSGGANLVPLDLGSVLAIADGQNPQVGLARERITEAYAQVSRADVLWLPTLRAGGNYNYHEGSIQDVAGNIINTNRNAAYGGLGAGNLGAGSPSIPGLLANFRLTDAIFQPKIARHQAASRQYAATATRNDILCDSAIAYLELLHAERRLAIEIEAREKTNRIAKLTDAYATTGQGSAADNERLLTELAARDNEVAQAEEAVQVASPKLAFLLHADASVTLTAYEPFVVPLNFTSSEATTNELVRQGLCRRPELAEHGQLVAEACERLQREKYAPLIPSVLLGFSYGGFGGGLGSTPTNGSDRMDADAIAFWEIRNLGFGEQAARGEASSVVRQARMRQVVALDRVAQEIVESHKQVQSRRKRIEVSKPGIVAAERSFELNLQRIENARGLPIEALQSVQALAKARRDYLNAVIDHNVAQVRLCRATGWFEEINSPADPK